MLQRIARRRIAVCVLVAVLVALLTGTGITSAADGPVQPQSIPTEINPAPATQSISSGVFPNCPATASWTVYLAGGSGSYYVYVSYGDGTSSTWSNASSPIPVSHTFGGCTSKDFTQNWRASSLDTTDYASTLVYYN